MIFEGHTKLTGIKSELPLEKIYLFNRNEYLSPGRYTIKAVADFKHGEIKYNMDAKITVNIN